MANQQPPEWWLKQREPRFGCADVTIVAVVAIAAFIILILILSKADFAGVVEQLPLGNSSATATAVPTNISNASPDDTATALALQAITPKPLPVSPTPNPNGAIGKNPNQAVASVQTTFSSNCQVLLGDKLTSNAVYLTTASGWQVRLTGRTADSQGQHYVQAEITEANGLHFQGWVENKCLSNAPNSDAA